LEIQTIPTNQVTPYGRNPRKNDGAVDKVAASIKAFGWRQPIVCDEDMVVIAGHTRLLAAKQLGIDEVPVHVATGLTPTEVKAYRLADNRVSEDASWETELLGLEIRDLDDANFDLDLLGFNNHELANLLIDPNLEPKDENQIPELPAIPTTKPGDLWILGQHRLLCGDCTNQVDIDLLLDGASVDLICTDPPYCSGGFQESSKSRGSVGTDASHKQIANDRLSTRGYTALLKQSFNAVGAPYIYAFTDWRMWVYLFDVVESSGYGVRSMIVWNKGTPGMGRGWRAQHELIMWGAKETPEFAKTFGGAGNVIDEPRTGNNLHTTEKPVALMEKLINNVAFAKTICDPFSGSGTTLIACERQRRQFFGTELDPAYCDVIVKRWEEVTGNQAIHQPRKQTKRK
tara:strand:- start:659 stop:1861 length:1203 start_codon:yes stop_codon:yes gene_type:complete